MFKSRIIELFRVCNGKFWNELGLLLTPAPGTQPIIYSLLLPFQAPSPTVGLSTVHNVYKLDLWCTLG